jgi:hypothetical protein
MNARLSGIGWMGLFLLFAFLSGCTAHNWADGAGPQPIATESIIVDLTPHIERLYLSWHELDQTYKDIKFLERAFLFDPDDRQLGYIQKAGLYIENAAVRIRHQWEQLSVLQYIRPEMMRDYLTLRVSGLSAAIKAIGYDDKFLAIYGSFIAHEAVTEDVNRARGHIEKNMDILNQILKRLLPLANATAPPTVL